MLLSPHCGVDEYTACHKQKPKEVTNITDWIQCFSVFIAIVSLKEPHRILGYQNLIVQSFIDSQEGHWIVYDRHFCLKTSAITIIEWSSIDITVWRMAFSECLPAVINLSTQNLPPYKPSLQPFSGSTSSVSSESVCLEWNEDPNPSTFLQIQPCPLPVYTDQHP